MDLYLKNIKLFSGKALLILETDKASMEIPSEVDGTVKEIFVKNGQIISPGEKI